MDLNQIFIAWEKFIFYYPIFMSILWMVGAIFYYYRREDKNAAPPTLDRYPAVSVLIPARNEGADIRETIESVVFSHYPNLEIIVINDASTDDTQTVLEGLMQEYDCLKVVHLEENLGKANGLNIALGMSSGEIVVTIDADCYIEPDTITHMVWHFVRFPRVGAVTGNPRVRNRTSLLAQLQTAEYSSVIGLIKRTQRLLGKLMTVSGVIVAWRKTALYSAGLWNNTMVTDDIDMTWRLETKFWDVRYEPHAVCWILVPETLHGLWRQRCRWAQGGIEVIRVHKNIFTSWNNRRIFPLYLDYCLSFFWAYSFAALLLLFLVSCFIDLGIPSLSLANPFFAWHGSIVYCVCVLQISISLYLDSAYDKSLWKLFFWVSWYPIVYWMLGAFANIVAAPKGFFGDLKSTATWVSPDRGIK